MFLTHTALLGVTETNLSACTGHFLSVLLTDALGGLHLFATCFQIARENCSAWVKHICECRWQCRKEGAMQCLSEWQSWAGAGLDTRSWGLCQAAQRSEVAKWVYHRRGGSHITQGSSEAIVFWLARRKGITFKVNRVVIIMEIRWTKGLDSSRKWPELSQAQQWLKAATTYSSSGDIWDELIDVTPQAFTSLQQHLIGSHVGSLSSEAAV